MSSTWSSSPRSSRSRNQRSKSSSMSPTRGLPIQCESPPAPTTRDPLQARCRTGWRRPAPCRTRRPRRTGISGGTAQFCTIGHQRELHVVVELVVHGHDPVVELELVGERRVEACVAACAAAMWLARPGVAGDPHLVDRQPLLGRAPVLLAQPDADLREVLQEEVREVLVGEDDARLDSALDRPPRGCGPARRRSCSRCSSGAAIRADGHHRRVRGAVRQDYFCHRAFLSSCCPNGSRTCGSRRGRSRRRAAEAVDQHLVQPEL